MEKKQACHVEWALLQLRGRAPIMVGATLGASQLMWVACRTSKNLVHVFQDGHLESIWRFSSDPVFLLFVPPSEEQPVDDSGTETTDSSGQISEASLLVFTSDSGVWHLKLRNQGPPAIERPTKKRKETSYSEFPKCVPEALVKEADGLPSFAAGPRNAGSPGCPELSSLKFKWDKIAFNTHARYSKKPEVKLVSEREFLRFAPRVSVAAYGPNDTVALLSLSGDLSIMEIDFSLSRTAACSPPVTCIREESPQTRSKDPTCIRFVSIKLEGNTVSPGGNVAVVSKKLFETMFGDIQTTTSVRGLLQGVRNGTVYTISFKPSEGGVEVCCSKVLCDLAQPIVAILIIPSDKTAGQKHDHAGFRGPSRASELRSDSILIVGQLGRLVLITGVKEESDELENGPFLPVTRSFSWRTRDKTSTAAELAGKGLTLYEWDLSSPITSACMLGPYRLCYCSRSEVLYVDLFESTGSTIHLDTGRAEEVSGGRTCMLASSKSTSSWKLPHASSTGLRREQWIVKEDLMPQIVPIADVVVAIVGRGVSGSSGASRPLIALTARGRLLGVEVSDHVSSPASSNEVNVPKTWQSLKAQREGQVQDLLQAVATVTKCTERIRSHNSSINVALKEFATAFPLMYDICSDQTRSEIRCPAFSLMREASPGKLTCFLTVTPFPSTLVSPKELSFRPSVLKVSSSNGSNPYLMKASVRLHNQTHVTLSQYWSLLLKLQSLYSDPTDVVSYSTVVNRGLGLPAGAHFSHDFIVDIPSTGPCPLLASIFLCHLHDPHQSIMDYKSPPCTFSRTLPQNNNGVIRWKMQSDEREKPQSTQSKGAVPDKEISGSCSGNDMSAMESSGSVCLLLSNYRVDLLSLFQSPPLTEKNPWTYPTMVDKSEQVEASCNSDHLLGTFSGNLLLSCPDDAKVHLSKDVKELWQKLSLEGWTQQTMLLTVAKRSSSSIPDEGTVSITLEHGSPTGSTTIPLVFQASSLLLGSLAREALLWRISGGDTEFHLQGSDCRNILDSGSIPARGQIQENAPDDLNDIVDRVQKAIRVWRNTLISRDSGVFPSLLEDTGSLVEAVLRMYRTQRGIVLPIHEA